MFSDFSVKVGSTNTNGTGSAANLGGNQIVLEDVNTSVGIIDGMYAEHSTEELNDQITVSADYWNARGQKELRVDTVDTDVSAKDFVDIDINLANSTAGVSVTVENAKRGEINTGSGDDIVNLSVQTNGAGWSNFFDIDTGAGSDEINITNSLNSQYTKFNIDAGTGDDTVDASLLSANNHAANARTINAGAGDDEITGSLGNDFIVGGAGADIINAGAGNDIVTFDSQDTIDAGEGFDALLVSGDTVVLPGFSSHIGFEAIIGESGTQDQLVTQVTDGLVIALGNDASDNVIFTGEQDFTLVNLELDAQAEAMLSLNGIDTSNLQAYYDANSDSTVWSDVDLLA
jgi:Ca2+-binding RTX toxin-like protein